MCIPFVTSCHILKIDFQIKAVSIATVLQQDPYLLLYEKCGKWRFSKHKMCVYTIAVVYYVDDTVFSLSINQCQRVMENQWFTDEVCVFQCLLLLLKEYSTDSSVVL